MSSSVGIKRLEKHIPSNIICTLSYIDHEVFPVNCDPVSKTEMFRILHYFLRTGENLQNIKKLLLEVTEGKENDLSEFVRNYKQRKDSHIIENLVMIFIGFFLTFGLFKVLTIIANK